MSLYCAVYKRTWFPYKFWESTELKEGAEFLKEKFGVNIEKADYISESFATLHGSVSIHEWLYDNFGDEFSHREIFLDIPDVENVINAIEDTLENPDNGEIGKSTYPLRSKAEFIEELENALKIFKDVLAEYEKTDGLSIEFYYYGSW